MQTFLGGLVLLITIAPRVSGQAATRYRFVAGDTLSYHAQNSDSSVLTTPDGPVPAVTLSESTVRLVFGTRGSATAAFTALRVLLRTPKGDVTPPTTGAINRPFSLTISDRGLAQTASAPMFPAELTRVVDLATEFDDFFLVLPGKPLVIGLTWADTVNQTGSTSGNLKFTRHSTAGYTVARDTTVQGRHCLIITSESSQTLEAVGPGPGPGRTVTNRQSGTETGFFLFDPQAGRLVGRQRVGQYTGSLRVTGGPAVTEYPLTRTILSGVELGANASP
jgi:hypothetical protein